MGSPAKAEAAIVAKDATTRKVLKPFISWSPHLFGLLNSLKLQLRSHFSKSVETCIPVNRLTCQQQKNHNKVTRKIAEMAASASSRRFQNSGPDRRSLSAPRRNMSLR